MSLEQNTILLSPEGKIDAGNAKEWDERIKNATAQHPDAALVLDFDRLEYISSAGLRVLLAAVRRMPSPVTLKNVSPDVYEILDMTGFTSLLKAERQLRRIDISGCEVIGRGATASVYRLDPDTIVKVYDIPDALELIQREQTRAKQAFLKGIPTAISYDAVRVGNRFGSVFELVDARTFVDVLQAEPQRLDELVRRHAAVMHTIHSTLAEAGELPDCRALYRKHLDEIGQAIPETLRRQLEERFLAMPEDLHLIHGDIHMKNVMLCGEETLLIDMETLSTGNPVFDLADLFVAYMAFNEDDPTNSLRIIGLPADTCREVYEKTLACYLEMSGIDNRPGLTDKILAVGYVRFLYLVAVGRFGGEELVETRVQHTVEHLENLLPRVEQFDI